MRPVAPMESHVGRIKAAVLDQFPRAEPAVQSLSRFSRHRMLKRSCPMIARVTRMVFIVRKTFFILSKYCRWMPDAWAGDRMNTPNTG